MSNGEADPARTATAAVSARPAAAAGSLGATLRRYRLECELGAGAMGVVDAALDPDLERPIWRRQTLHLAARARRANPSDRAHLAVLESAGNGILMSCDGHWHWRS